MNYNKEIPPPYEQPYAASAPPPPVHHQVPPTPTVTHVTVQHSLAVGCPVCHNNSWTTSYTCCGICLAIFCFPIGIICCCCMSRKKCSKCGFTTN